ncbi:XRE family transcriptional regulator [Brevundimonas vesicularis]|uniref:XRE family transcriptional regulator n=2 Tax=Brevundimonas TaxID=41275 RepID=UPI00384A51F6
MNMSLAELAEDTGLALNTLKRAEAVNTFAPITSANAKLLVTVLSAAGVIFIPGESGLGSGVRLASDDAPVERRRRRTGQPE